MRRWVSLGGWCGPSLILSKMGVRPPSEELPFDMVRCTMDGIIHFAKNGFGDDFFPPHSDGAGFNTDPVSIWLLFRGQHTCFTHYDLNNPAIIAQFRHRFKLWDQMVESAARPVTFLRTSIAADPRDELAAIEQLQDVLRVRNPRFDCRFVLVAHEQGVPTMQLPPLNDRVSVWALQRDPNAPAGASLFDRTHGSYERIVQQMSRDESWPPKRDTSAPETFAFRQCLDLAQIEGVSAFRGTCKGYGSTYAEAIGKCPFCGDKDGHPVGDVEKWDRKRAWTEDEDAELISMLAAGWDRIAAIEHVANTTNRGANEVSQRYAMLEERLREVLSGR